MTWWPVAGANRLQLMEPLLRFLERHTADFCLNVVPAARTESIAQDVLESGEPEDRLPLGSLFRPAPRD